MSGLIRLIVKRSAVSSLLRIFVHDNYCKFERFRVKTENFKNFLENFKVCEKKRDELPARCDARI